MLLSKKSFSFSLRRLGMRKAVILIVNLKKGINVRGPKNRLLKRNRGEKFRVASRNIWMIREINEPNNCVSKCRLQSYAFSSTVRRVFSSILNSFEISLSLRTNKRKKGARKSQRDEMQRHKLIDVDRDEFVWLATNAVLTESNPDFM